MNDQHGNHHEQPLTLPEFLPGSHEYVDVQRDDLLIALDEVASAETIDRLRQRASRLVSLVTVMSNQDGQSSFRDYDARTASVIRCRRDVLSSQINQILEAKTLDRARYYVLRLRRALTEAKTPKVNDINLLRWQEYDDVITDSLWIVNRRDTSGAHLAWYWGNFIPQIPHQMMLRYTKKNDWVLDTCVGSGTTLIECRRLGRNGVGIELNPEVARYAVESTNKEPNPHNVTSRVIVGDCRSVDLAAVVARHGIERFQLLMMHPPYHDIIRFSDDERDLSNASTTEQFLAMFGDAVEHATPYLENGRFFALVIGDKYSKGEWIPLGFLCMNEVLKRGYLLKSIIVKNFDETRGKRSQKELWRYRALVGGFYVFKHEYVMVFQKRVMI